MNNINIEQRMCIVQVRIAVVQRKVSGKTKLETEVVSGKAKKLRKATELGRLIFLLAFTVFYVALVLASSIFCNMVCMRLF